MIRPCRGALALSLCLAAAGAQSAAPSCFAAPASIAGEPVAFELRGAPPGATYLFDLSATGTSPGVAFGPFVVPLNPPWLFSQLFGADPALAGLFEGFIGVVGADGRAVARLHAPPFEALAGLALAGAFAVLDPAAPTGVGAVTNAATTVVVRPVAAAAGAAAPFFAPLSTAPATRFVAPTGSDANDGLTPATAWRQISRAAVVAGPGDVVDIADGAYAGPVLIQNKAGTEAAPLVFRASGSAAVLTGSGSTNNTNRNSIFIGESSWVVVEGLRVFASQRSGCRVSLSHHVTVRNCVFGNHQKWGIFTDYADDLVVVGNECFGSVDEHGIYLSNSGDRCVVVGNLCRDNKASGIQINADPLFLAPIGGYVPDGISWRCVVARNRCAHNGQNGGAGINLASVRACVFRDNVVVNDVWANSTGIALWDDAAGPQWGSRDNLIEHNTVAYGTGAGRYALSLLNGSTGNVVRNNVLRAARRGAISFSLDCLPGLVSDGNLLFSLDGWPLVVRDDVFTSYTLAGWQALGFDVASLHANAVFAAPVAFDWSLTGGSPGRDAGIAAATTTDHQLGPRTVGAGRDMGAYER
jgi:parallel beta-helix repeat protein